MALSQKVQESLDEALSALRNALVFAARNERSVVCNAILETICHIENIQWSDTIMDELEDLLPDRK